MVDTMLATLFIATGNKGKLKEIIELAKVHLPHFKNYVGRAPLNAEETADSFIQNAKIKSLALYNELIDEDQTNFWVLSDDSGLCVDSLSGSPGVLSARYAGKGSTSEKNIEKLLESLNSFPENKDRLACYNCALSVLIHLPNSNKNPYQFSVEGQCKGHIAKKAKGESGFGYDPVFILNGETKSLGELSYEVKSRSSHRTNAFLKLRENINSLQSK